MFSRLARTSARVILRPATAVARTACVRPAAVAPFEIQGWRLASSTPSRDDASNPSSATSGGGQTAEYSTNTPVYSTAATTGKINGRDAFNPGMFTLPSSSVDVFPLSGTCGAEVRGVDLSQPLAEGDKERILDAYFRYGAVFFRDQDITPAQHLALAAEFGEPEPHPIVAGIPGYPEIVRIIKEANTPTKFGETWHSDHSFMDEPCVGSILVARELPPYGNDTLWASMYAVYESLSDGMKALLNDMTAIHSAAYAFSPEGGSRKDNFDGKKEMKYQLHPILEREVEHPVIITHPVTGKKALYVNSMFTVRFKGMTEKESRPLLEYLFSVTSKPEFQCRFRWAPGSIAFWDNRATQHMAVGDEMRFRRVMERITLKGAAPTR